MPMKSILLTIIVTSIWTLKRKATFQAGTDFLEENFLLKNHGLEKLTRTRMNLK